MKYALDYKNKPRTIESESNLSDVLKKLINEKKSRLLVTENETITGIVTEKDLGLFLLTDDSEKKLTEIPLSKIVKKIISVDECTSMIECAKIMLMKSIGSLAVKSKDEVVGILTKTDLVRFYAQTYPNKKIVGEYMSPYYAWQYSDVPLYKIVSKMIDEKISRIILRNHNEVPVGVVTFRDLFQLVLKQGSYEDVLDNSDPLISVIFPRKGFISKSGFGASVRSDEVMSKGIFSVNYDDDLGATGNKLLEKNINGAGVLSKQGTLIGIISKTDILKAVAFLK